MRPVMGAREPFSTRIAQAALHSSDLATGETAETMGCAGKKRQVWDIAGHKLFVDILTLIPRLDEIERRGDEAPQMGPV